MYFILHYIEAITTKLKRTSLTRKTYRELNQLSNRELKDIGICRGDIRSISEEILYDNCPSTSNRNLKGWV